jgi:hypothetical protein
LGAKEMADVVGHIHQVLCVVHDMKTRPQVGRARSPGSPDTPYDLSDRADY